MILRSRINGAHDRFVFKDLERKVRWRYGTSHAQGGMAPARQQKTAVLHAKAGAIGRCLVVYLKPEAPGT